MRALVKKQLPRYLNDDWYKTGYIGTYDLESHVVSTDDSYILKLFRFIPGNADPQDFTRPVVFIQHGLMSCSEGWVGS
jgi:hypothetical protein